VLLLYLLIYLSRYLDQKTANGLFRSSRQAATCYYQSIHSKIEAITLSALPKDTTSVYFPGCSSHYPFNAERQAGKLRIPTFKSFVLTRPAGNRTQTTRRTLSTLDHAPVQSNIRHLVMLL